MELKFRGQRGRKDCVVQVSTNGGETYHELPLYLEWVNHSPTGFEWGYYGSGPSQLAYAILHQYFMMVEGLTAEKAYEKAQDIYMRFKQDVIAPIHCEKWEIEQFDIKVWLRRNEREMEKYND